MMFQSRDIIGWYLSIANIIIQAERAEESVRDEIKDRKMKWKKLMIPVSRSLFRLLQGM